MHAFEINANWLVHMFEIPRVISKQDMELRQDCLRVGSEQSRHWKQSYLSQWPESAALNHVPCMPDISVKSRYGGWALQLEINARSLIAASDNTRRRSWRARGFVHIRRRSSHVWGPGLGRCGPLLANLHVSMVPGSLRE